jgi:hypothetical protein
LANDLNGFYDLESSKRVEFNEKVVKLEFDQTQPINPDANKKNFIQENKKKIRSRSTGKKSNMSETGESTQRSIKFQSSAKKSALKKDLLKSLQTDEDQLYLVEDKECQTEQVTNSFINSSLNSQTRENSIRNIKQQNICNKNLESLHSNQDAVTNVSSMKQSMMMINPMLSCEHPQYDQHSTIDSVAIV